MSKIHVGQSIEDNCTVKVPKGKIVIATIDGLPPLHAATEIFFPGELLKEVGGSITKIYAIYDLEWKNMADCLNAIGVISSPLLRALKNLLVAFHKKGYAEGRQEARESKKVNA